MGSRRGGPLILAASTAVIQFLSLSPAVAAGGASLAPGDSGRAVKALQVRVAGWYPDSRQQVHFVLDGVYGTQTVEAVKVFQRHYGLPVDGIAGPATMARLEKLKDRDRSTAHFDWTEFDQNHNAACSARANAYAGTYRGGMVSRRRARRNARRLMWRLEALRAKGGKTAIGINSGFRSVAYNDCIGGARASQHMYATAADNRMAGVTNHRERRLAKRSEFHGIGCYASLTHNHFDVRIDNADLASSRFWWWPVQDAKGRELDAGGNPCWGEKARIARPLVTTTGVIEAVRAGRPGAGSLVPARAEVEALARAGEPSELDGRD
ncbi:MAG: D-Ala-D-Ala carboxypeptidase family metallohydrolase [Actinomycetota bacterium]